MEDWQRLRHFWSRQNTHFYPPGTQNVNCIFLINILMFSKSFIFYYFHISTFSCKFSESSKSSFLDIILAKNQRNDNVIFQLVSVKSCCSSIIWSGGQTTTTVNRLRGSCSSKLDCKQRSPTPPPPSSLPPPTPPHYHPCQHFSQYYVYDWESWETENTVTELSEFYPI